MTLALKLLLSCLCQAVLPSSSHTEPSDVQRTAERNGTGGRRREESSSDPYIHSLSVKCRWTLRMRGNRSDAAVALPADSPDLLVEQVCRDLGCGSVYRVEGSGSPPDARCFHDCSYRDGRLQNCSQRVGENCTVITEAICGQQAARLAGGPDRCAGRVELWRDGRWGTVCDDRWDLRDAQVVCAQLGCGSALSATGQGGSFPPGRGPVHLDELNCTGTEENLWACPAARGEPDCGHKEDAGVVCSEMRAVRLTGGLDRCSGRVEVHRHGLWGSVCDNCWNRNMASTVCSMLRCGAEPQKFSQFLPPLALGAGPLWFYECDGNARTLWQCTEYVNQTHLCAASKASGVVCEGSLGFPAATTPTTTTPTTTPTTTNTTTGLTSWPTGASSVLPAEGVLLPSPELLSSITLALLLLLVLLVNSVLCCRYRRRRALCFQQTRSSLRPPTYGLHHNSYRGAVDLVEVTARPLPPEVLSNPRHFWAQLSGAHSASGETDYEWYEASSEPPAPLSTFRNSQRNRAEASTRPSGPNSLWEEPPEPTEEVMGVFTRCDPAAAHYARVSRPSVDSLDTCSTSSGDTNHGYVQVTADPGPAQSSVVSDPRDPSKLAHAEGQLSRGQNTDLQTSGDEDDGPVYSLVSPDRDSASEDDYDDIDIPK